MEIITDFFAGAEEWVIILIKMALIAVVTVIAAKLYSRISRRINRNNKIHLKYINNIVTVFIYVLGAVAILSQTPGFSSAASTLLAGSGIAALTVGLAAQESLGNAISGMFISMFHPFEVGDRVRLINSNITGYIEDITMRHTVIRTFMNSRVIVPNSAMNKDLVENSNYLDGKASGFIDVIIDYNADMPKAQSIMAKIIEEHPDFVDNRGPDNQSEPKVRVYVRNLGLYGVELRASMWTRDVNVNFAASSEVRERIKIAFDEAGISFAHYDAIAGPLPE